MTIAAVVLAAGRGERLGHHLPKAFVPLLGKPLIVRSIETLAAVAEVTQVVPVVAADDVERFAELGLGAIAKLAEPVSGGLERQDSVRAGVDALGLDVELVAIHDAARCLITPEEVSGVIQAAREHGAALLASPARDTIKLVQAGVVVETPERSTCWVAQTPQVFRLEILREALAKAEADGITGTDDAQLVERLGIAVRVVEGDPHNMKITVPGDLAIAEAWLRARVSETRSEL
jgi:2-C-methyl-D-erythritol 4-phosphate cytidylyltransferase